SFKQALSKGQVMKKQMKGTGASVSTASRKQEPLTLRSAKINKRKGRELSFPNDIKHSFKQALSKGQVMKKQMKGTGASVSTASRKQEPLTLRSAKIKLRYRS